MKQCSKCKQYKSFEYFAKDNNNKYGLRSSCKFCNNTYNAEYYMANEEKEKARAATYRKNEPEKHRNAIKTWQKANPEKNKGYNAKAVSKWQKANPEKNNAKAAKYRASKLNRTPKWLTESDWVEINWAYKIASDCTKETGIKHEVDHVIPLQGDIVSGLHVPGNLQIITKTRNSSKRNKLILNKTEIL